MCTPAQTRAIQLREQHITRMQYIIHYRTLGICLLVLALAGCGPTSASTQLHPAVAYFAPGLGASAEIPLSMTGPLKSNWYAAETTPLTMAGSLKPSWHASGQLHLAMADTLTPTWHELDLPYAGVLPTALTPWVHLEVEHGDTLSGLFDSVGLAASQWRAVLALDDTVDALRQLNPGDEFRLRKTLDGRLAALHFPLSAIETLVIYRTTEGLSATIKRRNTRSRRILVQGVVGTSFPRSLRRAGTPAQVATALARIYDGRIDLSTTMTPGDRFSIIYAAEFFAGRRVDVGPIVAASIHSDGRTLRAFRRVGSDGEAHYYDARGMPYQPSIKRTPLNYMYVSSPFNMHRVHPVLGVVRPHTGVDLAAPRGTPVHAAADGLVTFVGWISGYGRIVKIDHAMGYSTRYAHLSGFAEHLDEGDHVSQGQVIAFVGASGLATGYHLHFEIRKNGTPHNPLTMDLPSGEPLSGVAMAAFADRIQPLIARMSTGSTSAPTTLVAARTARTQRRQACSPSHAIDSLLATATERTGSRALSRVFCNPGG